MPRSDVVTVAELLGRNPGATPHVPLGPRDIPRQVRREPWLTRTNKTSAAITFGSVLAVGTTLAVGSTLLPHRDSADQTTTPATTGPISDSSSITPHEPVPEHVGPAPYGLTGPSEPTGASPFAGPSSPGGPPHGSSAQGSAPARVPAQDRTTRSDPSGRSAHSAPAHAPAQGSVRTPARGSAGVPAQGRHAGSTPSGPHLDSQGSPSPAAGPSGVGRHRDSSPPPPDLGPDISGPSSPDRHGRDHRGSGHSRSGSDRSGDGGLLGGVLDGLSIGPL